MSSGPPMRGARPWLGWAAVAVVAMVLLAVGSLGGGERSDDARARNLEETIRCPQCASQAVAHSETPSARGVKAVIAERIEAGNTDEEIRDFIASRYGSDVLLEPSGSGFGGLVWGLPVVVAVVAASGLVYRFRDWRPGGFEVTDGDRDLVADALDDLHRGRSAHRGDRADGDGGPTGDGP
ncbi:hypothetical protein BH23ACT2_BH23ACT2_00550 [soil metagenome]